MQNETCIPDYNFQKNIQNLSFFQLEQTCIWQIKKEKKMELRYSLNKISAAEGLYMKWNRSSNN